MNSIVFQPTVLTCGACEAPLLPAAVNAGRPAPCARCGALAEVTAFPALLRPIAPGAAGERILIDNESSCFYHPAKKAVAPCDVCGRFLCALCDVEMNGQHLCPACIEAGAAKGKMEHLESQRTRYDAVALVLAAIGYVPPFWYFAIFTAPAAIFVAIRYWKTPLSPVRPSRWRFAVALLLAVLQLALMGLIISLIVAEAFRYD